MAQACKYTQTKCTLVVRFTKTLTNETDGFFARLGADSQPHGVYGKGMQRRMAEKDSVSCQCFGETNYYDYQAQAHQKIIMLTCVREIFFKMMTRLIFASFCSTLSLLSVASWAANETSEVVIAPLVATTPATASVQPSPAFIPPAKPATAANIPEKKAPAAADTIKPIAAVPAAKPLTPAKPAMAPPNTAASAVAAKRPFAAANRAPAQALPGNPIPTPLKPVTVAPPSHQHPQNLQQQLFCRPSQVWSPSPRQNLPL